MTRGAPCSSKHQQRKFQGRQFDGGGRHGGSEGDIFNFATGRQNE